MIGYPNFWAKERAYNQNVPMKPELKIWSYDAFGGQNAAIFWGAVNASWNSVKADLMTWKALWFLRAEICAQNTLNTWL